jgi:hypothetical protein
MGNRVLLLEIAFPFHQRAQRFLSDCKRIALRNKVECEV